MIQNLRDSRYLNPWGEKWVALFRIEQGTETRKATDGRPQYGASGISAYWHPWSLV